MYITSHSVYERSYERFYERCERYEYPQTKLHEPTKFDTTT